MSSKEKNSGPARATRVGQKVPLRSTPLGVGEPETVATPINTGQSPQLQALREKLRAENSGKHDAARARKDQIGQTLQTIRSKFGEEAFQAAVRDFKADFRNFEQINLLKNKGPGVVPEDHLMPPP